MPLNSPQNSKEAKKIIETTDIKVYHAHQDLALCITISLIQSELEHHKLQIYTALGKCKSPQCAGVLTVNVLSHSHYSGVVARRDFIFVTTILFWEFNFNISTR